MIDIKKITERRGELVCAKIDGMATEEELEELAQLNELLLALLILRRRNDP